MATLTECPDCEKTFYGKQCPYCGWKMVSLVVIEGTVTKLEPTAPTACPIDGGPLIMHGAMKGFCVRMGGFPHTMSCPFSCPLCRGKLDWTGGCQSCHGTTTGRREDWTFPGDGYYTHDEHGNPNTDGMHYCKEQGPRKACSQAENAANAREIAAVLGRLGLKSLTPDKEPRR